MLFMRCLVEEDINVIRLGELGNVIYEASFNELGLCHHRLKGRNFVPYGIDIRVVTRSKGSIRVLDMRLCMFKGGGSKLIFHYLEGMILLSFSACTIQEDACINTNEGTKCCKLNGVHAGLEKGKDVKEQIIPLRAKDTKIPRLNEISGNSVLAMPEELANHETILVSGHHETLYIEGLRFIIVLFLNQ
uniref:Calcineurin-like phosphoesterase n=1 Tax=Tanacetum cinerariifolium TaxID=118510 RepID=A0A6L2KEN0_TANCI|nr:calcineurin-like phosphoesterase [Tanacetum cinerariifolium]